jgi:hypothetical protein
LAANRPRTTWLQNINNIFRQPFFCFTAVQLHLAPAGFLFLNAVDLYPALCQDPFQLASGCLSTYCPD